MMELIVKASNIPLDQKQLLAYMRVEWAVQTGELCWTLHTDLEIERPGEVLTLDYNGRMYWRDTCWEMTNFNDLIALRITLVEPLSQPRHYNGTQSGAVNTFAAMWNKSIATK